VQASPTAAWGGGGSLELVLPLSLRGVFSIGPLEPYAGGALVVALHGGAAAAAPSLYGGLRLGLSF
jgi:hypothetical protein